MNPDSLATDDTSHGQGVTTTRLCLWGALLVVMTLVAYGPVYRCGFIWDDDDYVLNKKHTTLASYEGLWKIWSDYQATPQYYPLVHTTYWVEYQLFGQANAWKPWVFHTTNVLLHAAGAVLLWLILRQLAVPGAWVAATVFALHPVQVESVAWIAERKNVLAGLFYLGAALAYLRFAGLNGRKSKARRWKLYGLSLLLFVCALLSKTVTASLPAALLLVTWWKRGRISRRDVLTLAPMLAVGLVMGLLTVWLERERVGARGPEWEFSVIERCIIAGRALWFYAAKLAWPVNLTFIYPRWQIDASAFGQCLAPVSVLAVLAALWALRRRIGSGPLVAVLFFAGTLVPALGFFNFYPMRYSFVADHFQYLAGIGLIVLAVAGACATAQRRGLSPHHMAYAGGPLLVLLGILTWSQTRIYQNTGVLWNDTLKKNPASWIAHNELGRLCQDAALQAMAQEQWSLAEGKREQALRHFETAIRLKPDCPEAHENLGYMWAESGYAMAAANNPQAAAAFQTAIRHLSLAIRYLVESRQYNDTFVNANGHLGEVYLYLGQFEKAAAHFSAILQHDPRHAPTHKNLAVALGNQGKLAEAIAHARRALAIAPNYQPARDVLNQLQRALESPPQQDKDGQDGAPGPSSR